MRRCALNVNPDKNLVFVVSGGRTGTQFFGDRLSLAISQCYSVHDPDILSIYGARNLTRMRAFGIRHMLVDRIFRRRGIRATGQQWVTGKIETYEATSRLRAARESYYAQRNESLIIESNSQWLYSVELLPKVWPQAKIVVIFRDPRTWIRSWINKGFHQRPYDPVRWFPPGRITPAVVGDRAWVSRWRSFDTFGRLAWEWHYIYSRLYRFAQDYEQVRIFRFEDLFGEPLTAEMRRLVDFTATHPDKRYPVDIPDGFGGVVQNASSGSALDWADWSSSQRELVDELCGGLMRDFGYLWN